MSYGDELFVHYHRTLEKAGAVKGLLGLIFGKMRDNSGQVNSHRANSCLPQTH